MASTHIRLKKVEDFWQRLKSKKAILEAQLNESYTKQDGEAIRLLIQGEIKALSEVIMELEREFGF
ncbi:hypothetical protein [Thermoactinomyces sp. CICC 10522]|uniref:hypothetical protein n=1 Tax=Thermoactinomyces sp. CICC 10522 TaxID=2767427 RepID=UPI0018DC4C5F|nr:hypothetical protein [Thermoactinomyces sp. CICC 10522]MBH8605618.1 hypothetical protein [Thermoactinomyces sp. CICC 10522]